MGPPTQSPPTRSPQTMPPPPKPQRVDEDETMDIVPDSEPSRATDGPMSSLHLPRPVSRVPTLAEDNNEIVPESSGETDDDTSEQIHPNRAAQDTEVQETEAETEREDDPMDSNQPLVKQRPKQPPKPVLEEEVEEQEMEEQEEVHHEIRDDATVPETEDEVPLAAVVKPTKAAPKPLPPRGRSMRNKRPIIYTESPDTSENEVSTMKL